MSHDRAFLRSRDHIVMVRHDGRVLSLPEYDSALDAFLARAGAMRPAPAKIP